MIGENEVTPPEPVVGETPGEGGDAQVVVVEETVEADPDE